MAKGNRGNQNAGKRADDSLGPWVDWPETDRADRAIRFIETYCVVPKGHGAGKPVRLGAFQKAFIRKVLRPGNRAAVLSLPRGNGKSTLLAALAVWAVFDPYEGGRPQVPIIAVTVKQAIKATYSVALDFVNSHPELKKRAITYSAIGDVKLVVPSTRGELFPIAASDPGAVQGLDPGPLAIVDEIGFIDPRAWDAILLASGKRPGSLVVGIGTPGLSKNDNALWDLKSKHDEGADMPGFVYVEYSADPKCDVRDESQWYIANPALEEGFMDIEALRMAVGVSPEASFRVFKLGQWADGVESWLGPNGATIWDSLRDPYALVPGAKTWLGLDVGLKQDSTALVALQQRPDGRFHAVCRIWMPSERQTVDIADIMGTIRQMAAMYDVETISYDPRLWELPAQMLADDGLPMVEVPQSVERMTPIIGELFKAINEGRISHDGEPAFRTQVLNAVPRLNERGFTLQKSKSKGKIDAAIALGLALERADRPVKERPPIVVL